MRTCLMMALACGAMALPAMADGLLDTHFSRSAKHPGGCLQRDYTAAHLAQHPDRRVTFINLAPLPPDAPPDTIILNIMLRLRGGAFYSGIACCTAAGAILACGMEGDAGQFILTGRADSAILLTVGRFGLSFEGEADFITLHADKADDRAFVIPDVVSDDCNQARSAKASHSASAASSAA